MKMEVKMEMKMMMMMMMMMTMGNMDGRVSPKMSRQPYKVISLISSIQRCKTRCLYLIHHIGATCHYRVCAERLRHSIA